MFLDNKIKKIVSSIKHNFIPFYKEKEILKIFRILNSDNRKNAMFVGGCVRKYLLKEKIDDIDIATPLTPSEIIKKFHNSDFEIKKTGIQHGTLTLINQGKKYEITTLREDIATDGRHATVTFTNDWRKDSDRRDFTINAIYLDENGKLFDPHDGFSDLRKKQINFIGDAEQRIKEDYLRILRFIRFTIQYDSEINPEVIKKIKLNLSGFKSISKERIYDELLKILSLKNFPYLILKKNELTEIFMLLFPELKYLNRLKKFNKTLLNEISNESIISLLVVDQSNNSEYFSYKYKISNKFKYKLNLLSKYLVEIRKNKNFFSDQIKKNLYLNGKNLMLELNLLTYFENKKKSLKDYQNINKKLNKITIPEFPYDGKFLIDKGLSEGKKIGRVLKLIEEKWLENKFINLKDEDIKKVIKRNI